jgi:hypothetical protein
MSRFKQAVLVVVIAVAGAGVGAVAVDASTPKPSGYCAKKEIGKVVSYTTPSKSATYKIKCTVVPTQKWKKVK